MYLKLARNAFIVHQGPVDLCFYIVGNFSGRYHAIVCSLTRVKVDEGFLFSSLNPLLILCFVL